MLTDRPLADIATRPRPGPASPDSSPAADRGVPGERLQRLAQRRRLLREEMIAVAALLLILAVTVAILAAQWLASAPAAESLHHLASFDLRGNT